MTVLKTVVAVFAAITLAATSHAQVIDKKALSLAAAKKIAAAAEADAKAKNVRVVIAVVDDGGNLLVLQRLDDTQVASVKVPSTRTTWPGAMMTAKPFIWQHRRVCIGYG